MTDKCVECGKRNGVIVCSECDSAFCQVCAEDIGIRMCKECKEYVCEDCIEEHPCYDGALEQASNELLDEMFDEFVVGKKKEKEKERD